MTEYCNSNPGNILAYYYLSFNDSEKQRASNIVSSLLAQICSEAIVLPKALIALYERCDNGRRKAAIPDLKAILKLLITKPEIGPAPEVGITTAMRSTTGSETTKRGGTANNLGNIFILIDALDECPQRDNERQEVLDLIKEMKSWSTSNLHLLVTSRKEVDIEETLVDILTLPPISIQGSQVAADIDLFVDYQLKTISQLKRLPQDLKLEIKDALVNGANGM